MAGVRFTPWHLSTCCLAASATCLRLLELEAAHTSTTVGVFFVDQRKVGCPVVGMPKALTSTLLLHTASKGAAELVNDLQAMQCTSGQVLIAIWSQPPNCPGL